VVYPRNGLLIETIGNVVRAPLIVPAEGRLDRGRIARRMAALTNIHDGSTGATGRLALAHQYETSKHSTCPNL